MSSPEELAARNEVLFREVNAHIVELAEQIRRSETFAIVCECGRRDCLEGIEVEPEGLSQRSEASAALPCQPGARAAQIERVVERTARFLIVEKTGRAAAFIGEAST